MSRKAMPKNEMGHPPSSADAPPSLTSGEIEELERCAEALWQAESVRATDARRRSNWSDESGTIRERWRFMAHAAIAAWNLRTPPSTAGWLPISTAAPKDGTWILGWARHDRQPYRISWGRNQRGELAWCTAFSSFVPGYITDWMPLPPAPSQEGASEGDGENR